MSREQQIKQLAEQWEKLGGGRYCEVGTHFPGSTSFHKSADNSMGFNVIASLGLIGTDTDDASPCLALLRDVYGEDWAIREEFWGMADGVVTCYTVHHKHPDRFNDEERGSTYSRLHAVCLALEAKESQ